MSTKASEIRVDVLRQKAGLGVGQYVLVRDDPAIPDHIVVSYMEHEADTVAERFDTTTPQFIDGVIAWLREMAKKFEEARG